MKKGWGSEVRINAKNKDLDLGIQAFGFECKKA